MNEELNDGYDDVLYRSMNDSVALSLAPSSSTMRQDVTFDLILPELPTSYNASTELEAFKRKSAQREVKKELSAMQQIFPPDLEDQLDISTDDSFADPDFKTCGLSQPSDTNSDMSPPKKLKLDKAKKKRFKSRSKTLDKPSTSSVFQTTGPSGDSFNRGHSKRFEFVTSTQKSDFPGGKDQSVSAVTPGTSNVNTLQEDLQPRPSTSGDSFTTFKTFTGTKKNYTSCNGKDISSSICCPENRTEDEEYIQLAVKKTSCDGSNQDTELHAILTPSNSQKKRNRRANKNKSPPKNPGNLVFKDSKGQVIAHGSREYIDRYVKKDKIDIETLGKYKGEYRSFVNYVVKHVEDGGSLIDQINDKTLDPESIAHLVACYISDRSNKTYFRETGEVKLLDTSTMDRIWSGLCFMIKMKTDIELQNDPRCKAAREAKTSYCRQAKQVEGLGELANQSVPWTLSMVLLIDYQT